MFKKLRNKFLILSMAVTSLILLVSFAVIYASTYQKIQNDNIEKLEELSSNSLLSNFPDSILDSLSQFLIPSNYSLSFSVLVDEEGNFQEKISYIDMPEETYTEAALKVWRNPQSDTPIQLNGRVWQYSVSAKGHYVISINYSIKDVNGYMISFLDVTESHKTLQTLLVTFLLVGVCALAAVFVFSLYFANHAIKPISTAWEAQKQFIADASHELKTPITIINSNYDVLISKKKETIESQMKWLAYIKDGTDRMSTLVSGLLTLARYDATNLILTQEEFNLSELILEAAHTMDAGIMDKNINFIHNIEPNVFIKSDAEKISQVLIILLDNAVKYTDEKGLIACSLVRSRRHIRITVKNSGKGIAAGDLPKIFDRFYRADQSRTNNGSSYGLGLSIAKTIADSLNADISVRNESDGFTIFEFSLHG